MEEYVGMTDRQFKIYNRLVVFAMKLISRAPEEQREKLMEELRVIMSGGWLIRYIYFDRY